MTQGCSGATSAPATGSAGRPVLRVGVLALQGNVAEHRAKLEGVGAEPVPVRRAGDLAGLAGLVIPGGESTVMDKLLRRFGVFDPLRRAIRDGLPVLGTCAGMVLLADRVLDGTDGQQSLGGLDITVRRNAFGRQVDSFEQDLDVAGLDPGTCRAVFIRAPWVETAGPQVQVLAEVDGHPVAVRAARLLATAFHPELTADDRVHRLFVQSLPPAWGPGPGV